MTTPTWATGSLAVPDGSQALEIEYGDTKSGSLGNGSDKPEEQTAPLAAAEPGVTPEARPEAKGELDTRASDKTAVGGRPCSAQRCCSLYSCISPRSCPRPNSQSVMESPTSPPGGCASCLDSKPT
jgi:hypothetical protein